MDLNRIYKGMNNERIIILLKLLKEGNFSAFDEFYTLTKYPIYYSLLALVKNEDIAEDILAETYLKFLKNLRKVKSNKNPLGFLLTISRNLALDYFKKEKRITSIENYVVESEIGAYVEENYDFSDVLLERMRTMLTPLEYEVVVLRILSELTHKEIATLLKKPLGTITWTYQNAIKKLQKGLSDYDPHR